MEGRVGEAMAIQNRLVPLHDALFAETSPAPVKFAASLLGKTSEHCRLPLAPIMESTRAQGAGGDDRRGAAELANSGAMNDVKAGRPVLGLGGLVA